MVGSNNEISDVEKMQHLKMSLTNEAAQLVRNISVTGENFTRAWEALVSRYDNKRVLGDNHLAALFSVRQVTQESAHELKSLLGDITEAIGALSALGNQTQHWDPILVYLVVRKLDSESLKDWENLIGSKQAPAKFSELETFLLGRIRALEAVERVNLPRKVRSNAPYGNKPQTSAKSLQTTTNSTFDSSKSNAQQTAATKCGLCSAAHYISSCPDYRNKTPEQRREIVNQKNLCFNCLGPHQFRNCRTSKRCQVCGNPHHTSIHRSNNSSEKALSAPIAQQSCSPSLPSLPPTPVVSGNKSNATVPPRCEQTQSGPSTLSHVALTSSVSYTPVFLATALIQVTSCYGEKIDVRALLDQGSEVSFITESLAQRLNHPRRRVSLPISGIGAQQTSVCRALVKLELSSRINPSFSLSVNTYVLAKLTSYLPPIRVQENLWPHLSGLDLADPGFSSSRPIDLVLGAEVYSLILEEGLRKGSLGSPIAQQTAFGWILSGSVSSAESEISSPHAQGLQCSVDHHLLDLLQRFWIEEEASAIPKASVSEEESQCEQHFVKSHSRSPEGRYTVRLPLKRLPEDLGDSRRPALYMLSRQETRFRTDLSLKLAYTKFLAEYEDLDHMALVPETTEQSRRVYYLPHHAVVRESSSTTKVRVVFNGSQRTNFGISINDLLHVGPKVQTDLTDVITRWRRHANVFSADIEKMYRQIRVHQDDWDLQRILWRTNPEESPRPYHLRTVTYGLACAPYLAIRTLRQLSIDENDKFPLATDIIQRETYVDDVLSGADEIEEAQNKIREISRCLEAGCFSLQKWTANCELLLAVIPQERRELSSPISIENDPLFRALGILWQPRSDSFVFTSQCPDNAARITKRTVLSRVAQLYDPLGWISPVVVRGKLFMQELWTAGLDWDQPLPEDLASRWKAFVDDLQDVSSLSIPRWLGSRATSLAVELHGFSDASQAALGAVVYLRVVNELDDARVTLVSSKTRVAPLKQVTIPRLELSAALLLVRQIAHVRKSLDLDHVQIHLWTDSTVALAYIQGDPRRWADYVRNRVTEIQDLDNSRWHHVPGKENPADCASRGISPRQLKENTLWWNGPSWLCRHSTSWPNSTPTVNPNVDLEVRKTAVDFATQGKFTEIWNLVERYSNLNLFYASQHGVFELLGNFDS